jgi:pimeloyl-ACP methyl ester carboxylesterase
VGLVEVFAKSWCVIRYDIRGHGKSAFPTGEKYAHADDLAALLEYLSIPRAVVVGQSLGGEIAINFALRYPHRIRRLVLADTSLDGYKWSDEWYES